jgi:ribosomal protein S18 acetylase RimI-like enzyme
MHLAGPVGGRDKGCCPAASHSPGPAILPTVRLSHDGIRRLEAVADRAWPPAEVAPCDGWELRATGPRIGRRVNSVATTAHGALPLAERLSLAEDFYRQRGLAPTFKLTAASLPTGLDGALAAAGYRLDAPVSVRTRALPARLPTVPASLAAQPTAEWRRVNAAAGEHYGAAPRFFLELIARIRAPLCFATVEDQEETAAAGMAVAEEGWVGLFEIGTHPSHRRRGGGRQVVSALLAWGAEQGASRAYLQVMPANTPALALYRSLGFEEAYRYWYRVAPADGARRDPPAAGA